MRRLRTWWRMWVRYGITPWQYEHDLRLVRRLTHDLKKS